MPYHLPLCENSEIMKSDNPLCLYLFPESQNLKSEFGLIFTKKSVRFRYEFWKFESEWLFGHTVKGQVLPCAIMEQNWFYNVQKLCC